MDINQKINIIEPMDLLKDLNTAQVNAVQLIDKPLLISAGAGSGKTRVITYKIAYLIHEIKVKPFQILGVTFTNKAANEVLRRVSSLTGINSFNLNISTFHSFCTKVLKQELDFPFIIIDENDKRGLISTLIEEMKLDKDIYDRNLIASTISKFKMKKIHYNNSISANDMPEKLDKLLTLYKNYEEYKEKQKYFDFDDLLIFTLKYFYKNKEILNKYKNKFQYILVDEFQDTNDIQYELVYALGYGKKNITIVGDPDQSIYSWRGASPQNFKRFLEDFKGCVIIKLEQNYRSTNNILQSATNVIAHNSTYDNKKLWSEKEAGEKLKLFSGINCDDESRFVVEKIEHLLSNGYKPGEIAIFCRTNYYYQNLEFFLREYNIPYQIIGGLKFFERQEIKNLIVYLRFLVNINDEISLLKIVNISIDGIGKKSIENLKRLANKNNLGLYELMKKIDQFDFYKNKIPKIKNFVQIMEKLLKAKDKLNLTDFMDYLLEQTQYQKYLEKFPEFENRLNNIEEFIDDIIDFDKKYPGATIKDYIDKISLYSDIDKLDEESEKINIITIHNAKGLEFKVVFIIGLQEGMFPHYKVLNSDFYDKDIEEERRLFYVGITRAKEKLFLSNIQTNQFFNRRGLKSVYASRFLSEIPSKYIETVFLE